MPVMKNQRYNAFERDTARDSFRGLPLQQFPWVLESREFKQGQNDLRWQIEISCLSATPSGFGAKLNFHLEARATLTPDSVIKHTFAAENSSRVGVLFSGAMLSLDESSEKVCEGLLEELGNLAKSFAKEFEANISRVWSVEKVTTHLRQRLRQSSPGGFGERYS